MTSPVPLMLTAIPRDAAIGVGTIVRTTERRGVAAPVSDVFTGDVTLPRR